MAGVLAGSLAGVPVQPVSRTVMRMDEIEFKTALKNRGLTVNEACILLFTLTGVVVDRRDIEKAFRVSGRLSRNHTAMWRLLFRVVDEKRGSHERIAV